MAWEHPLGTGVVDQDLLVGGMCLGMPSGAFCGSDLAGAGFSLSHQTMGS